MPFQEAADAVARSVVRQNAVAVDREAAFPTASIDALREAGLLGLISAKEVGGLGQGPRAAALVVERLGRECASTAMVLCMHYVGTAVLEAHGPEAPRKENAAGEHLLTLAFSESGSRSHFWAPVSTAEQRGNNVELNAQKSWVTSANHATAYVWSSKPLGTEGSSSLWWVPRLTDGLSIGPAFDGIGLRGNDSTSVRAEGVVIPRSFLLGRDGDGLSMMLDTALPFFNVMNAAASIGNMESATGAACKHAAGTHYEHLHEALAALPTIRAYLARMRIATDQARGLMLDTIDALEEDRADAMLRVLQCKAAAGEAATQVLDTAMRVCGGAAFRKELGVERRFRDARAATVMAPTTDQLYDFIGKAICGLKVF